MGAGFAAGAGDRVKDAGAGGGAEGFGCASGAGTAGAAGAAGTSTTPSCFARDAIWAPITPSTALEITGIS